MVEVNRSTSEDDIVREVFDTDNIEARTEVTPEQIEKINKLKTLAIIFNNGLLKTHLDHFMILLKSKDRKSMGEFVSSIKAKRDDMMDRGRSFFNNMVG